MSAASVRGSSERLVGTPPVLAYGGRRTEAGTERGPEIRPGRTARGWARSRSTPARLRMSRVSQAHPPPWVSGAEPSAEVEHGGFGGIAELAPARRARLGCR